MGIDYGSVRIGIALSDPLQIISRPYKVIPNTGEKTFSEIKKIIKSLKYGFKKSKYSGGLTKKLLI